MRQKLDSDASTARKALRLYQKLLLDGRRHFQTDLAEYLHCSPQTVIRLIAEIEGVVGAALQTGLENRRRWYQIRSISRNRLGLDFEELRYLAVCRDLAEPYLPDQVKRRVDQSLFNFSVLMADPDYARREQAQKRQIGYCAKGWIDYTPYFVFLEHLVKAQDEKKVCLVRYQALARERPREYRLAVGKIIGMNNALYALGATMDENCREPLKFVSFAINRIKAVTVTGHKWDFEMPADDLNLFGLPWHDPRHFRIRFISKRAAEYVRERIWSEDQKFSWQMDGSLILEMTSRSRMEVEAWVRSFGPAAELLEESPIEGE